MAKPLISASGIGKKYVLRHQGKKWDRHRTLRDELAQAAASLFRRKSERSTPEREVFWALKDISFDIRPGEAVGFIGHNGAGKSTLLKLISRVTEPTSGEMEISGRVASLLEVGTGFHSELTGRENIYLKGAIMGMKRAETRARFDEIVEFAEIERFLDTPVKRYSSGMYVKLGFAVAAHLDPEILIVDEVLAVGDAQFQRKCIAKMREIVAGEGKTILFVSHNLGLIQTLCTRAIIMKSGTIVADGAAQEMVGTYLQMVDQASQQDLTTRQDRHGAGEIRLVKFSADAPATGRPARFSMQLSRLLPGTTCSMQIVDKHGNMVANLDSAFPAPTDSFSEISEPVFVCEFPELALIPGRYLVNAQIHVGNAVQDSIRGAGNFDLEGGAYRERVHPERPELGSACLEHRWIAPAGAQA